MADSRLKELIAADFAGFIRQEGAAYRANDFADYVMPAIAGWLRGEADVYDYRANTRESALARSILHLKADLVREFARSLDGEQTTEATDG